MMHLMCFYWLVQVSIIVRHTEYGIVKVCHLLIIWFLWFKWGPSFSTCAREHICPLVLRLGFKPRKRLHFRFVIKAYELSYLMRFISYFQRFWGDTLIKSAKSALSYCKSRVRVDTGKRQILILSILAICSLYHLNQRIDHHLVLLQYEFHLKR